LARKPKRNLGKVRSVKICQGFRIAFHLTVGFAPLGKTFGIGGVLGDGYFIGVVHNGEWGSRRIMINDEFV